MSSNITMTAKQIWKKLTNKEYRDSYVAAHISNTVASQIFMLREQRRWTQKELARQAGMNQSRISALEDPNYENIEVGTLKRLASAFDVALTVRFTPFSELATWTAQLSGENLLVADFASDRLPQTNTQTALLFSHVVNTAPTGDVVYAVLAGGGTESQGYSRTFHMGVTGMRVSGSTGGTIVKSPHAPSGNAFTLSTPITLGVPIDLEAVNG
jgi:transcriptional regulator with XRE-family HTH domain